MRQLDLLEINTRGDQDFDALNEVEKDLYVLLLFETLRDMEGVSHFFHHHSRHLPRLLALLGAARAPSHRAVAELGELLRTPVGQVRNPLALDGILDQMGDEGLVRVNALEAESAKHAEESWARVRKYIRQRYAVEFK